MSARAGCEASDDLRLRDLPPALVLSPGPPVRVGRRARWSAILAIAIVLVPATGHAGTRTEDRSYILTGRPVYVCDTVGGGCFNVYAGERLLQIHVGDSAGRPVAAEYSLLRRKFDVANGAIVEYEVTGKASFCGSARDVPIAAGSHLLHVVIKDIVEARLLCGMSPIDTSGTITATFTS